MGLAGSWAAGAVLVDGDEPARFDQVTTGRAAIFTGGRPVRLPDHRDGWRWEPYAVDGADVEAARQQLQRLMRDAEADIAEALSNDGWLTEDLSDGGAPTRPGATAERGAVAQYL